MKKKRIILTGLLVFVLLAAFTVTQGAVRDPKRIEEATSPQAEHDIEHKSLLDSFHNPWPGVTMGADFRFRVVTARNISTLEDSPIDPAPAAAGGRNSNKHFFNRYRFRWWTKVSPEGMEGVDFNIRFVWEFRNWDEPVSKHQSAELDEIIIDRFNIAVKDIFGTGWDAVFGRQDIIFGTGWLVLDGTPLDGSRTIFFDAIRLTYNWEERDTKIDLVYISNRSNAADRLKPINDQRNNLTQQDEDGFILYITNNSLENTQLEGYFIYKNDQREDHRSENFPDALPGTTFPFWSRKAEIFTIGGAIQHKFNDNWHLRTEGAFQMGHKDGTFTNSPVPATWGDSKQVRAWGARNELAYHFLDEKENCLHLTYEFLSGDDPDSERNEQFDPLWGEWPQWSDLYVYTYSRESMIGETTNLHRLNFGHSFKPHEKLEMKTDYHLLWADENTLATRALGDGFGWTENGKFRGQLFTWLLKYTLTKQIKGHLLAEYFVPGNYYERGTRDHAYFLRFNIEYTF